MPIKHLIPFIPFLGVTGNVSVKSVLESVIIAGIVLFGTVQVLGTKIDGLNSQLARIENTIISQDVQIRVIDRRSEANLQQLRDIEKRP